MFGAAVYLSGFHENCPLWEEAEVYFTSFHIAEEFSQGYRERANAMLAALKQERKRIIADISPRGIHELGYESLADFAKESGVDIVRCDYGFSKKEMAEAAHFAALGVNASTMDAGIIGDLSNLGAQVYAIHNFYPRPETGLDTEFFTERNTYLHKLGVEVMAFISGDEAYRGPLFEGLPTLEHHRNLPPYVQYMELVRIYGVNAVLAGDPGVSVLQRRLIAETGADGVIRIPAVLMTEHEDLYGKVWTIREDSPRWIARLSESRGYAAQGERVPAKNCGKRMRGSITMDNEKYLRYSGEIQIVREELPACERVNVIGKIAEGYEALTEIVTRGVQVQFVKLQK